MIPPARPRDEASRQATLEAYRILDTPREAAYDDLVAIAVAVCDVPMAFVSLIDGDRQWFKAGVGLDDTETLRDLSFCGHTLMAPDRLLVINDTHVDPRFADHPMVVGPTGVRFYAGAPLRVRDGSALGAFCVLDQRPRELAPAQLAALEALSRQASRLLELHRVSAELHLQIEERHWYEQQLLHYQHELELENASLAKQTTTDPLTGLLNRRGFSHLLDEAIEIARMDTAGLSLALIDIDHFKAINDAHGHGEGDRVLQALGTCLRAHVTARGRVARLGGEEFVYLMPGCAGAVALEVCERLRTEVESLPVGSPITVSIGLASLDGEDDAATLLARADAALYDAKRGGRNRVCNR